MKKRTYRRLRLAAVCVGLAGTAALLWITWRLREVCSVIAYIANRG